MSDSGRPLHVRDVTVTAMCRVVWSGKYLYGGEFTDEERREFAAGAIKRRAEALLPGAVVTVESVTISGEGEGRA